MLSTGKVCSGMLCTGMLCVALLSPAVWAQGQATPTPGPGPTPATPAPAGNTQLPGAETPTVQTGAKLAAPREVPSKVNTGGGFSIEPFYWRTGGNVQILAGKADNQNDPGNFKYPSPAHNGFGMKVNVPLANGTLRVSYFQEKHTAGTNAHQNLNLYGVEFTGPQTINPAGDPISAYYKLENFKFSYDYLTYFWRRQNSEVRLKTLWEFQRISLSNQLIDFTPTDNTLTAYQPSQALGTQSLNLPSFGLGLEQTVNRHFRWEAKGSGFGLLHGPAIVDAEGEIAYRRGHLEVILGDRYMHFKTSPKGVQFNTATVTGPFLAVRYYFKKQ